MKLEEGSLQRGASGPGHPPIPLHLLSDPPQLRGRSAEGPWPALYQEFRAQELPEWALVRQRLDSAEIRQVAAAVDSALGPVLGGIRPGMRVCLAVGSRGIDRIDQVVKACADALRRAGAEVFLVPAMGSHGGATAAGQLQVLAAYGITPETVGCEIRASMETSLLGEIRPGLPVFIDRAAFQGADLIVPINRVKPHTDFSGAVESGLSKMIAIGLGKQRGADTLHRLGFARFFELIPEVAAFILARAPIPFGLALIENGHSRLMQIEAVPAERIAQREPELLQVARAAMARLPLSAIDVLVLDFIGKDISGLGMDSNVVGRYYTGPTGRGPAIQRIVVRDLTAETEGNAVGIGLADVVLRRAVERMDRMMTYVNCITAKTPEGARIALTADSDRDALGVATACCLEAAPAGTRLVRARDTKHLEYLYVSSGLLPELLAEGLELVAPAHPIRFDEEGMFTEAWP